MNSERAVQAAVAGIFTAHCGRNRPVAYQELAALSGVAAAHVYAYAAGEHLGAAVALVQLCRQVPEAAAALQALVDAEAEQGAGCELDLLGAVGEATGQLTAEVAATKGRICHRARARFINAARRLKARCGLYLAFHAQRAA